MELFEQSLKIHDIDFVYDKSLIQKSHGYEVYKDVTILTPGEWADSITNAKVLYREDVLRKSYTNWDKYSYVNLGHSHYPLDFVGTVQNKYYENGVKADLFINQNTSNGRDIIEKINADEVNKLSVELRTQDYWDVEHMMRSPEKMLFLGVSILGPFPSPACTDARIK
jgi:phage head maturation protease